MLNIKIVFLLTWSVLAVSALNFNCKYGQSTSAFDELLHKCPRLSDSSDEIYCCIDIKNDATYCCNAEEFARTTAIGIILPVVLAVILVISLIVCCVSCLCCSCCPWYRRRHRGTIYGHAYTTPVVHVIQTPSNITAAHVGHSVTNPQYSVYSDTNTAMTGTAQPPATQQYTTEAFAKQAPYNPHYAQ